MRMRVFGVCAAGWFLLATVSLQAESFEAVPPWRLGPPQAIVASSGMFEPIVGDGSSYEIGAEVHFAPRRFRFLPGFVPDLIPTAGIVASAQGALFPYAGLRIELPLGERWVISPGWSMGFYYQSYSKDLGGPLEFRTQIEVAYRLNGNAKVGLCLYHLSNGGLSRPNPGSESLVVTYGAGLRSRRPGR